jgi:RNA polymerase sigma-70 factor (ECF subfamily)
MIDPDRLVRLLDDHAAALELYAAQWADSPADVVQEAFIRLAEQAPLPDRILPWLYTVVRNGAISATRAATRRNKHERNAAELHGSWFDQDAMAPIDAQTATAALRDLPEEFREVLVARIWGGLSFEEIGELTGASSSTAHRRYESGLRKLRVKLGVPCEKTCETTNQIPRISENPWNVKGTNP